MIVERMSIGKKLQEEGSRFRARGPLERVQGDGRVRDREAGRERGAEEDESPARRQSWVSESATTYLDVGARTGGGEGKGKEGRALRSNPNIHPRNLNLLILGPVAINSYRRRRAISAPVRTIRQRRERRGGGKV